AKTANTTGAKAISKTRNSGHMDRRVPPCVGVAGARPWAGTSWVVGLTTFPSLRVISSFPGRCAPNGTPGNKQAGTGGNGAKREPLQCIAAIGVRVGRRMRPLLDHGRCV